MQGIDSGRYINPTLRDSDYFGTRDQPHLEVRWTHNSRNVSGTFTICSRSWSPITVLHVILRYYALGYLMITTYSEH